MPVLHQKSRNSSSLWHSIKPLSKLALSIGERSGKKLTLYYEHQISSSYLTRTAYSYEARLRYAGAANMSQNIFADLQSATSSVEMKLCCFIASHENHRSPVRVGHRVSARRQHPAAGALCSGIARQSLAAWRARNREISVNRERNVAQAI